MCSLIDVSNTRSQHFGTISLLLPLAHHHHPCSLASHLFTGCSHHVCLHSTWCLSAILNTVFGIKYNLVLLGIAVASFFVFSLFLSSRAFSYTSPPPQLSSLLFPFLPSLPILPLSLLPQMSCQHSYLLTSVAVYPSSKAYSLSWHVNEGTRASSHFYFLITTKHVMLFVKVCNHIIYTWLVFKFEVIDIVMVDRVSPSMWPCTPITTQTLFQ